MTGGMGSIATLAARFATQQSKNSSTGKVTDLNARDKKGNPVYGGTTLMDTGVDFISNKLSPVAGVFRDLARGQMFGGEKPTVGKIAQNLFVPMPVKTFMELQANPNSANIVLSMILEELGISTNTY